MQEMIDTCQTAAAVLEELFNFDGQLEELCCMSEMEGEFGLSADEMIAALRSFIQTAKSLG
ncbi:MAG: hypothetical protein NC218_11685 [Acetobacter sp.]|nr:hypothetical protein [Acetobacter sp.]